MLKKLKKNKAERQPAKKTLSASNPQGISASGNALRRVAGTGLAVVLVVVAGSFTYLLLARESKIQNDQLEQVATSYASQQATNLYRLIGQLRNRMEAAASSPLALSAIANRSAEDVLGIPREAENDVNVVGSLRKNRRRAANGGGTDELVGASVQVVSDQPSMMRFGGAASDGDGRYRLEGVVPGTVTITVGEGQVAVKGPRGETSYSTGLPMPPRLP